MQTLVYYYSTTLGKKVVVAVTGLVLFAYVLVHMAGNLQFYAGPSFINAYAGFLHSDQALPLLWGTRLVLLAAVVLHMTATLQLWIRNLGSRPVKYAVREYRESAVTARLMIVTGPAIGLFVVFHILHLTTHTVTPAPVVEGDLFRTMVGGFSVWYVSAVYIAAMLALGLHFWHGLWSWFQTLGLAHPQYNPGRRLFARAITVLVIAANISFPVSVLAGLVN